MFERPQSGERALLVSINFDHTYARDNFQEFRELAISAGAEVVSEMVGTRYKPDPKYFVGRGKLEELAQIVQASDVQLVLFNHDLTPSQERNLEKKLHCRVFDRTELILDIFAQRARSFEGKLQVELAQLEHQITRLVGGWTHLERQRGGIGMHGPGETQLETDRRIIRNRIRTVKKQLQKVRTQRAQGRRSRRRAALPTISLVGYTNAGKSTLFNSLVNEDTYVADQLFATLDPTLRRIDIPEIGPSVLADTVGFVSHLPHQLVAAFSATLQETAEADLLLHVIDASNEHRQQQIVDVETVLSQIEASHIPCLQIYNKIDRLENIEPRVEKDQYGMPCRLWMSAHNKTGIALLQQSLIELLGHDVVQKTLLLSPAQGALRAALHNAGGVIEEAFDDDGNTQLIVRLSSDVLQSLLNQHHFT